MLKVMIVEDDLLTADMLEEILVKHGYEVCGIATNVAEAVALGTTHAPDLAVIDVRLADGDLGTDIPGQLSAGHQIGILYASGNISQIKSEGDYLTLKIAKPYSEFDILRGLEVLSHHLQANH